jgi:hypothetical protein
VQIWKATGLKYHLLSRVVFPGIFSYEGSVVGMRGVEVGGEDAAAVFEAPRGCEWAASGGEGKGDASHRWRRRG